MTGLGVLPPDPDIQAGNNHTFTRTVCIQYVDPTTPQGTGGAGVRAPACPPGDPTSMVRITVVVSSSQPETSPVTLQAWMHCLESRPSTWAGRPARARRPMTDQRGLSLVELLVAAMLTTVVAGGLFSAYIATTRSFGESSAQAALQRQGTLVLEEIGRQVRGAIEPKPQREIEQAADVLAVLSASTPAMATPTRCG